MYTQLREGHGAAIYTFSLFHTVLLLVNLHSMMLGLRFLRRFAWCAVRFINCTVFFAVFLCLSLLQHDRPEFLFLICLASLVWTFFSAKFPPCSFRSLHRCILRMSRRWVSLRSLGLLMSPFGRCASKRRRFPLCRCRRRIRRLPGRQWFVWYRPIDHCASLVVSWGRRVLIVYAIRLSCGQGCPFCSLTVR